MVGLTLWKSRRNYLREACTDAEGSMLVLDEHMDGPALEVELPTGELVERGPLPVVDGDADDGGDSYNKSSSVITGNQGRILAFLFDRGKRSPQNARGGEDIPGLALPFYRGKDSGNCSMKDGGLRS